MVSAARFPKRYRILEIAIAISIAVHFLLGGLLAYKTQLFAKLIPHVTKKQDDQKMVALSSAVTIEQRTKPRVAPPARPQPQQRPVEPRPHVQPKVASRPHPMQKPVIKKVEQPAAKPTELAKIVPHATAQTVAAPIHRRDVALNQPPRPKNASQYSPQQLEEMQRVFERQIAMSKVANDPTRVDSTAPPSTMKRARLDIAGVNELLRRGEGILTPREQFRANVDGDANGTCYYVDYQINFSDGKFDSGPVYWPICYHKRTDPFINNYRGFPLPPPQPGWQPSAAEWTVIAQHPLLRTYFPGRFPNDDGQ